MEHFDLNHPHSSYLGANLNCSSSKPEVTFELTNSEITSKLFGDKLTQSVSIQQLSLR